jgi:hypothetical protein
MSIKNNLNPWDSAPAQTPTASPPKKRGTDLWKFHEYQPRVSAPTQTVTNVPNPQQIAVAYSTHDYYSHQYSNPGQFVTVAPGTQHVPEVLQTPLEVQGQTERDASATFSYAKTIWIEIDEETQKKLKSHGEAKVQKWAAGKVLSKVFYNSKKNMSLYDAKMINANAPEPIIPTTLPKVKVVRFTVDPIIRERLKPISASKIRPLLESIGVDEKTFHSLKLYTGSVKTKHAEKYNEYFRRHNLGANTQNTDVFDLERILNLGNDEPIETTKKLEAFIKIEPEHQKKLTEISKNVYAVFKKNFLQLNKNAQTISLKNAILINKISGDEIFKINEEAVQKYSIHQDQVKELESVLAEDKPTDIKIRTLMRAIKYGKRKFVTAQEAEDLNAHLKSNPFGFASYLSSATQEAEDAFKQLPDLPTHARGKKRKSTTSSEDPATLRSKKQRTQADDQQIPLNVNQGSFQELQTPGVAFNASVTLPQESIISLETTALPEEFNSPVGSNAFAETNQNESSSAPFSPLDLFQDFNGFEPAELNNGENIILDSSDWNFLDSINEDFNQ